MRNRFDFLDDSLRPARAIWYLAWPVILEQVLIMLVTSVDAAMVGSLGPNATAAVALTSTTTWLLQGARMGVAIGFSVPVGRYIGAGQFDKAREVIRQAVVAIFAFGLLSMAIMLALAPFLPTWLGGEAAIRADATRYLTILSLSHVFSASVQICGNLLRCMGDTRTPLALNVASNLINVTLNFLLIYPTRTIRVFGASIPMIGAGLGVSGAAIATAIATCVSGTLLLFALFRPDSICAIRIRESFRPIGSIWKEMLRLGYPVTFERVVIATGQLFVITMVTSLGTASLAAHSLGMTVESLTYMPAFGFSSAATTLVAQSLGANRPDKARLFAKCCTAYCVIFMSIMGVVLFLFGGPLISIFTPSGEVIAIGAAALRVEALAQPFLALSIVISGVLRGARKTKWPLLFGLVGMWAVRLPLSYFFTNHTALGLAGAWMGMASDLVVRGLASLLLLSISKWSEDAPALRIAETDGEGGGTHGG